MALTFYLLATAPLVALVATAVFRRPAAPAGQTMAPPDRAPVEPEAPRKAG